MPVYTVHAPVANGADLAATDRFVFVRDGFHFWAAVASVIWLLWHRLWLALIGWIVLMIAVHFGMSALGASRGTIFIVDVLIAILMGFEAASLRRWTLSRVVIDISGRPVLVFKVEFPRDKVGQFDTELVREWFNAFTINAGVTLHVETLYGENSHHIAESCFKGLARALRAAVAIDPRAAGEVPSTKGQLGG